MSKTPTVLTPYDFGPHVDMGIKAGVPAGYLVTPGSIEASEKRGQQELVESQVLPVEMSPDRAAFEAVGFVFGESDSGDLLFQTAKLPSGWSRRGTDHSMWSEILDDQGRVRVTIFYKAAFYDRRAHMSLVGRYDWAKVDKHSDAWDIVDRFDGEILYRGESYEAARSWWNDNIDQRRTYDWTTK